jgi:hypothetical protein
MIGKPGRVFPERNVPLGSCWHRLNIKPTQKIHITSFFNFCIKLLREQLLLLLN